MLRQDRPLGEGVAVSFGRDHRKIRALLDEVAGLAHASDLAGARRTFATFAAGLRRHIEIEDLLLFMPFEKRTGMADSGPTAVLRREHREIEQRLESLSQTLLPGQDAAGVERQARALLALLDDHARREETILYPTCDRIFDAAEEKAAVRALGRRGMPPAKRTRRP